jgi:sigma-B regulation protein RsbU (phosphoserine phosphatase)
VGITFFILTFFGIFRRLIQIISLIALVMASSGIIIFTIIGDGIFAHLYHSGVMMALVGLFAFLRLRFVHVISGGFLVIIIYVLSHVFIVQTDSAILAHNASNMVGIVLIGVFISYFHEYYIRQGYIQALQLEQSSQKLASRNKIIERDLAQARSIQQRYIPESRPTDYIYALYKPMDMVGGDYFQFITFQGNGKIGIFISDVSGHGMPAAMITSMLRISISRAGSLLEDPQALLLFLNGMLHGEIGSNFITCVYGLLDRNAGTFTCANAGHCSPLVITPNEIRPMEGHHRVPLAAFGNEYLHSSDRAFINRTEVIPRGGKLLLYTDGLLETTQGDQSGQMFEYHGLSRSIESLRDRTSEEFVAGLYRNLTEFRGNELFNDDICIICADL